MALDDKCKILYRESCGCMPYYVRPADADYVRPAGYSPCAMAPTEKDAIIRALQTLYSDSGISFRDLVEAFIQACDYRDSEIFLAELEAQIRDLGDSRDKQAGGRHQVPFYPYLISNVDTLLWSGDLFFNAQAVVSRRESAVTGSTALKSKADDQILQEMTQQLLVKFSSKTCWRPLKKS